MVQSLAEAIYSNPSLRLERSQYAAEFLRLQKDDNQDGMKRLIEAHKYYINYRNQSNPKEMNDQHALRTLDWLSYLADLLLQGRDMKQAEAVIMSERKDTPQHLWPQGLVRNFYHAVAHYDPPFGVIGFETILDHSVYSMPFSPNVEGRVLLLINKLTLSEDHVIDFLKNKMIELDTIVTEIARRKIGSNTHSPIKLEGMTQLEYMLLTLPEELRNKLAKGYEDCIKEIRRNLEIPKEPAEYLSIKLGVVSKEFIEATAPRDNDGYNVAMKTFSMQARSPIWKAVVPFDQLAEQNPKVILDPVPSEKTWYLHQAAVDVYSFFSDPKHFARLTTNQNHIPEELLLQPVQFLGSSSHRHLQN